MQWHPTPVLLPGRSHGRRSLVGCSPWGRKELDTTERLHFHFSLSCIGEGNGNPLQCSCLENPRVRGAWWAAVFGVRVRHDWSDLAVAQTVKHLPTMRDTWVWSLGQEDPLEKEMATHSSTLAWKIPWTEEPGRLHRHNWVTLFTYLLTYWLTDWLSAYRGLSKSWPMMNY